MLYRKIEKPITEFLENKRDKVLVVQGARQIGKSYIIRYVGHKLFKNVLEINLVEDKNGDRLFADVKTTADFYLRLSLLYGDRMDGTKEDTLVFLDEIQEYPHLITMLKFLNADARYTYVASGSLLGVTLQSTVSIPVGSLRLMDMYPLDFEEFIRANSVGVPIINHLRELYGKGESPDEAIHARLIDLWRKYLIVGGLPDAVNEYLATQNIAEVRAVQNDIIRLYSADAAKYDLAHKLKIKRVYETIPSYMENKKKRVVVKEIEGVAGSRFSQYMEEFDYLVSSGIALEVTAVSNPRYPLAESVTKNFIKLYLNDPGLLTSILYGMDSLAILQDKASVNLGAVYESAVAAQLASNGHKLYYFDNKKKGEVDFLVNDRKEQTVLPIEVKSGRDYMIHSAISRMIETADYGVKRGIVLSNSRTEPQHPPILHLPIYYAMFL